jgi:hypothetical protein
LFNKKASTFFFSLAIDMLWPVRFIAKSVEQTALASSPRRTTADDARNRRKKYKQYNMLKSAGCSERK